MDMDFILKNTTSFKDNLVKSLKDPEEARAFLDAVLEEYKKDGDARPLRRAIGYVTEAQGGFEKIYGLGFDVALKRREREAVAV